MTSAIAIALGLVANEISEVSPWLARKILRCASRWEAQENDAEAGLIFGEQIELLKTIPGRIAKLVWAVGRMRFGLRFGVRFALRRLKRWHPTTSAENWVIMAGYSAAASFIPAVVSIWSSPISSPVWNVVVGAAAGLAGLAVVFRHVQVVREARRCRAAMK